MLSGGEVVAIQEADPIAGQQRWQTAPQLLDDRRDPEGGFLHHSSGHGQFDVLQLVVHRLIADGKLLFELAVSGMDGRFLAEDDSCHQVHEGGEQEFVGVLPLCRTGEQFIEV
jgi:hypothetical protein